MATCPPCDTRVCAISDEIVVNYSLQTSIAFNTTTITVIVECLPGYYYPAGDCPTVVNYPPGTFVIPVPPTGGGPIVIALMGCTSMVQIVLPAGSSAAAVAAAAQSVILQVAQQQALCDVLPPVPPGDGPDGPIPPGDGGGPIPPNPVPSFFNQAVYYFCDLGSVINYTGVVPGWLTVDTVNNRLVMLAGTVGGTTQALANTSAQNTLNNFGDARIIAGELTCVCITNSATLPAGTVGVAYSVILTEASPGAGTFSLSSGTLPAGLSLNPNTGEIAGTPTTAATSVFIITYTPV